MPDDDIITIDDILADLKSSQNKQKHNGVTATEFAEILGIGEKKAAKMLRKLVHSGKLKVSRAEITDVTGRKNFTFVYHP